MTDVTGEFPKIYVDLPENPELDGKFEAPMLVKGQLHFYFRDRHGQLWGNTGGPHSTEGWVRVIGPTEADLTKDRT